MEKKGIMIANNTCTRGLLLIKMKNWKQFGNLRIQMAVGILLVAATLVCYFMAVKGSTVRPSGPSESDGGEWLNVPEPEMSQEPWSVIGHDHIYEVPAHFLEETGALLEEASVVTLAASIPSTNGCRLTTS
jgi:hypothetical protein